MKRERKQYSEKEKKAAISLLNKGNTQRAVADKMGIHFTTINRWSQEERFGFGRLKGKKIAEEENSIEVETERKIAEVIKADPKSVQKTTRIQVETKKRRTISNKSLADQLLEMAAADPVQICSMSAPINDLIWIRMTLMGNIELSSEAEELLNKQKPRTKKSG